MTPQELSEVEQRLREGLPDLEERLRKLEEARKIPQWLLDLRVDI